jgi:hypothetical protein
MTSGKRWRAVSVSAAAAAAVAALLGTALWPGCGETKKSTSRAEAGKAKSPEGESDKGGDAAGDGAGEDGKGGRADVGPDHVVVVMDDGFDVEHEVFKGKILATYTIDCEVKDKPEDEADAETLSDAEMKAKYLESYASQDSVCVIKDGIDFQVGDDYAGVLGVRQEWNANIKAKKPPLSDAARITEVQSVIGGAASGLNYHGTNTAGMIVYQNPKTKLVLLQYRLRKPGESIVKDKCPTQKSLDQYVRIHKDAAVRKAYVEGPIDDTNRKLNELVRKHKITIANLSLGSPTADAIETQLAQEGCGQLSYNEYYQTAGQLNYEREKYRYANGVYDDYSLLVVQAAGNEGVRIDDFTQTTDCGAPEHEIVMVGALDAGGQRASFTNFGKCVQVYMMGHNVIVPAPRGFLDISSGTSFSAPLLSRHVSLTYETSKSPRAIIEALEAEADTQGHLPASTYPTEIAYENASEPISQYALQGARKPRLLHYRVRSSGEIVAPRPFR